MDACEYDSSEMPPSLTSKQRLRRWKIPQSKSFSCCGHVSDKSSIRQDCSHFVVSPSGKAFSCSSPRYLNAVWVYRTFVCFTPCESQREILLSRKLMRK
eukprot:1149545-Lingulodinium_polyedra.AAC.1